MYTVARTRSGDLNWSSALDTATVSDRFHNRSNHPVLSEFVSALDVLVLVTISLVISGLAGPTVASREMLVAGFCASTVFYLRTRARESYDIPFLASLRCQSWFLARELAVAFLIVFVVLDLLSWPIAQVAVISSCWTLFGACVLAIERVGLSLLLGHKPVASRLVKRIAVIGSSETAVRIRHRLETSAAIQIAGCFDDAQAGLELDGRRSDIDIEALVTLSRQERLDAIVIAIPYDRRGELASLCLRLRTVLADVYVAPHLLDGYDLLLPETRLGPCFLSVAQRRPLTEWQSLQKTVFDRIFAALLITCLLPFMTAIALIVRIDSPGPIIFRQTRLGLNNRPFTVFKFRTMRTDQSDFLADRQTSRGDPRVTRSGRWLRRLSLDELPQLFNVILGSMSLVGPRPHALNTRAGGKLLDEALAEYVIRHQIRPGITGWAQVNGARGELTTIEQLRARVVLDLDYMRRWSLMFDVKVLVMTITREIFSRHAY